MIINSDNLPFRDITAGEQTQMQVLISDMDAPHFAMRRFRINPGGFMPNHTNSVEHEQYVLKGKAEVGLGKKVLQASKGDVLFIPAGVPHSYKTIGDEPYEFLCLVPNKKDTIHVIEEKDQEDVS